MANNKKIRYIINTVLGAVLLAGAVTAGVFLLRGGEELPPVLESIPDESIANYEKMGDYAEGSLGYDPNKAADVPSLHMAGDSRSDSIMEAEQGWYYVKRIFGDRGSTVRVCFHDDASGEDVVLSIVLSLILLVLFVLLYHRIFAVTFDEAFARAAGLRAGMYNMIIAALTAVTIVLGMRMMGAMLISALIIFPALTSMRFFKTFRQVVISSAAVAVVCFFLGITVSYLFDLPGGASVVLLNLAAMLVFSLLSMIKNRMKKE